MQKFWWTLPRNEAHQQVIDRIWQIERRQSKTFDKFIKLETLYDPHGVRSDSQGTGAQTLGRMIENVVASNVDTVTAVVASTDVRARFQTDDADWSHQRRARHLELYSEQLAILLDINAKARRSFKGSSVKGAGLMHVYIDRSEDLKIAVEVVPIDEIIVDESETHDLESMEIHRRRGIDRERLKLRFPGNDAAIDAATAGAGRVWRMWGGYRSLESNEIVFLESYRRAIGTKGEKGYVPGRYIACIDGYTLVDEEWEEPFFPFVVGRWSEPLYGWYGIGGAERIAGHQLALNKRNWQIDRQLDLGASPTTYVSYADAKLAVATQHRAGTIIPIKGEPPTTVTPPLVNPETYKSRDDLKQSAFEEFGGNRLIAQSMKPAGIDSGAALREYHDQTSQRFSTQEEMFEFLVLRSTGLVLWCCKKLGAEAPTMMLQSRFGQKKIPWAKVDMRDIRVSMAAASTLARTPAGREQAVIEWAQAGVISQDEARRLIRHPDLERAMSIFTAALESVEECLEEIADGNVIMPEPFMNLAMCVWRGQLQYLNWVGDGAPESILENLRQFVVQAAWMEAQRQQPGLGMTPAANVNAPGAAAGQAAMPAGAGAGMPPLPGAPPPNAPATAAFSPQAMQTIAGAG